MNKPAHYSYLLIAFLALTQSLQAQQHYLLKGTVATDSLVDFQVNIINVTQHTGTITKLDGSFEVKVIPGDELIFSVLGYENYELTILEEEEQENPMKIELVEAVNTLAEVKLNHFNLTGDLLKDAPQIQTFDQTKVGIRHFEGKKFTQGERRLYTATSSSIDHLINAITGRLKILRKLLEYEKLEGEKEHVFNLLKKDFFTDELNLPEDQIENFLYYCLENLKIENKNLKGKPMELIEFLKEQSIVYQLNYNRNKF